MGIRRVTVLAASMAEELSEHGGAVLDKDEEDAHERAARDEA